MLQTGLHARRKIPAHAGQRAARGQREVNPRKIPAGAGATTRSWSASASGQEDPRTRGDEVLFMTDAEAREGRYPHTRGRHAASSKSLKFGWKIPAHAGTTITHSRSAPSAGEDPRACGDDGTGLPARSLKPGGSPRMRGRRRRSARRTGRARRIPAHAGTTSSAHPCGRSRTEDPRACGDDLRLGREGQGLPGGSPRMRGRHFLTCGHTGWSASFPSVAFQTAAEPRTETTAQHQPQ
ncbi:hypothetical protein STTU_p0105 (plasmid) [Streptomyces sp. Tu6071]|nr:hypothetical protein STTU_p0105 [Streptomyces sp. Tu6071]